MPGNPDALGTSRVLTINPGEFSQLGTIAVQADAAAEGPRGGYHLRRRPAAALYQHHSRYVGIAMREGHLFPGRPDGRCLSVRRPAHLQRRPYHRHSQPDHPHAFERLSMQRVEREVDGGINSVSAALGDAKALSPFFRIPGFGRTNAIERFLESKQLVIWSADVDTDDWWRGSSPEAIVQRAMRRLNAKGRGIILMHDIHRKHGDGATDPSQGAEGEWLRGGARSGRGRAAEICA